MAEALREQIIAEVEQHIKQQQEAKGPDSTRRLRLGSPRRRPDLFGRATTPRSCREVQDKTGSLFDLGHDARTRRESLDDLRRTQGIQRSARRTTQAETPRTVRAPQQGAEDLQIPRKLSKDGAHGASLHPMPKANSESMHKGYVQHAQQRSAERFWKERPAAGAPTAHHRRFDTPAGTAALMGRARSQTPDYHRRYSENALGTSLPGCHSFKDLYQPETPRSRPRRCFAVLTPSRPSEVACRFNRADGQWFPCRKAPTKQAYGLSSSRSHLEV
mmetsp:Transcript_79398/g.97126  ORF Transcript_79398/g.97126 Transcript_79398/m.97126 type:complete len:274 (-) Transcript_79398:10-831(-)